MLRKGDQGADRSDPQSGNEIKQNTQNLLLQDEKAKRFFDDIQRLKMELRILKGKDGQNEPEPSGFDAKAGAAPAASAPQPEQPAAQPAPQPAIQPAPAAQPVTQPAPTVTQPVTQPAPAPQPAKAAPAPQPIPATQPAPVVQPAPQPAVQPAPAAAQPAAEPAPAVQPAPAVTQPVTQPAPTVTQPAPAPQPAKAAPAPQPIPATQPAPAPQPVPPTQPAPAIQPAPTHQPAPAAPQPAPHPEESERVRRKAIRAAEKEAYRREKAARNEERREERRARAKKKQMERELRAEVKRKKRLADKSAEMGGGIVNLHDTKVTTEIQPVGTFSWRDLLGIVPRSEKKAAATEEERQALKEEQEKKTAEARATAAQLSHVRQTRYQNSAVGRRTGAFKTFCERHKTLLLTGLSMVLLVCVGAAGVINYCTAYEYSYNGHVLGYVKSKDQVLQITDMVQRALTEDKEMQVVIDAKDDISFRRVSTLDKDVVPDSSDEVLRRLTYIGDLNVKAYGVYINGDKVGAVESKEVLADVLKNIEDRYASDKKGTEIIKAEILETVDVRKSNTNLRDVYSEKLMTDLLCTSGKKETVHTVIAGETLNDIAMMYGTTEEQLLEDNEGVDPKQLVVGSTLLIRQNAPLLTVRMTEKRSYTRKIKYETVKKKTDEMYEDEKEVQQKGKNGSEAITEQTVSVNGEVEATKILSDVVTKKPVKKIVLIGTAERPPSVGDGKYIWPLESGYTLTSNYGYRWGRLHAGIDLGTHVGNDVLAADGGIVTRAGYFGGYGYCVDIDHQNGQMTRYGHLSSILVNVGDEVYEGMHIAESGNTGRSTGPHLHFEIHVNGQTHDPLQDLP